MKLSKLKKVPLREVWEHEARDFTTWFAKEENLALLSEEIGVNIQLTQLEANVGSFKVDMLAVEEGSDRQIIIENQLNYTDHDHLGKIITYASGYDAEIIIWIVRDVRDEHRRAIEWLNEHTDSETHFFLIRIVVWQIDNSDPAPKFEIIVSPNEWAKAVKTNTGGSNQLTETKLQYLEFWQKFKEYTSERGLAHQFGQKAQPSNWMNVTIGSSKAFIQVTATKQKNLLDCGIYIRDNKDLYYSLKEKKVEIDEAMGEETRWIEANKDSRIIIEKQVGDVFAPNELEGYFAWLCDKAILFKKVFDKYLKEYQK